jgi:hypothetical protein
MIERLAGELGLDTETRARVEALAEASRQSQAELHDELGAQHEAMRDLLMQSEPDEAAVMKQAEAIGALETEMQKQRLRTLLAIRRELTPEQREKLGAIHARRRAAHMGAVTEACADDLARLCPDAEPGRGWMRCLGTHRKELSPACAEAARPMGRPGFGRERGGPGPR